MLNYYSVIVLFSCTALGILSILVHENVQLDKKTKRRFYETYIVVALAAFAEWLASFLNGAPSWTIEIHVVAKCMDYILTPMAGVLLVRQISKMDKWQKVMWVLLGANAVFQMISVFTGWTYYVDSATNYYYHGPMYLVYMSVYIVSILFLTYEFQLYGKQFAKRNQASLYAIVFMACAGIAVQEIVGSGMRTSYLSLTFGSILLFIHYSQFGQQAKEATLSQQRRLIETDALTGMYSRYAHMNELNSYNEMEELPENLSVYVIDINGLKETNDSMGHVAGDELIRGAAECIAKVTAKFGKCFRTGGDEFVLILSLENENPEELQQEIVEEVAGWRGTIVDKMSLSVGYACAKDNAGLSVEELIHQADRMMYYNKAQYYRQAGIDRRKQQV